MTKQSKNFIKFKVIGRISKLDNQTKPYVNKKKICKFPQISYIYIGILKSFSGEDNDNDKYHVAQSWVTVKLRDINDNKPIFEKANIEALVRENARVGKKLESFRATDPDQGGKSQVRYEIDRSSDRRRQFAISADGTVSIQRQLDRETSPAHQIKILAIDDGDPPKTATATLTVIVQDINDNSPRFLKNYR